MTNGSDPFQEDLVMPTEHEAPLGAVQRIVDYLYCDEASD